MLAECARFCHQPPNYPHVHLGVMQLGQGKAFIAWDSFRFAMAIQKDTKSIGRCFIHNWLFLIPEIYSYMIAFPKDDRVLSHQSS